VHFKDTPAEVAELASMSMELISMEHWEVFFDNPEDLKRAKRNQLEGILKILPWIATVDHFQQILYTNRDHKPEERLQMWIEIAGNYQSNLINWSDYKEYKKYLWQQQLHIFEVPFYYIEYGIAQLGAIAIWRNYLQNPSIALDQYEAALKLGYQVTIPEIYQTAGIKFDFSFEYILELMDFVRNELNTL
jgi:oligoendopeptidase F